MGKKDDKILVRITQATDGGADLSIKYPIDEHQTLLILEACLEIIKFLSMDGINEKTV